ncbi:MAG: Aminopeptidase N-like protein [Acidobacteria bacterium]|nr:Aminopeptidase N-like protein [Acidobacteriota bacterium]
MKTFARLLAVALALFVSAPIFAATDPTYAAVHAARPDGRSIALTNFTFDRDVYHLTLNGTLHLLTPVDGKTFGGVFIGQGSYELKPASEIERRSLVLYTGDDKLTTLADTFERATFFSADLIKAAEGQSPAKAGSPASNAVSAYDDYLAKQRKDIHTNIHVRVAQELLNGGEPAFIMHVDGKKYPPALAVVDPRGADALAGPGYMSGGEQTTLFVNDRAKGGFWYSSHLRAEVEKGQAVAVEPLADASNYAIDATILGRNELSGTTTMTFTSPVAGTRLLPINVYGRLRLSDVSFSPAGAQAWTPIAFIQEKEDEDPDAAIVFPSALEAGKQYLVKFVYKGKDVLKDAGDGNFSVGARQSWYPNVGTFTDLATYDLTFHTPPKFQIVASGSPVSDNVQGDQRVSVWKTSHPQRVAGFNYGKFKKVSMTDKDSGMVVDVYTNPGTPDIIREINRYLESISGAGTSSFLDIDDAAAGGYTGPSHVRVDTGSLAQSAIADGVNTARTATVYFGPLADKHVSITQQSEWDFGQSWPSLIYLPYLAFIDGTTRNTLGLNGATDFVDQVGPHEFGHQWWGHSVGWRTYHDQWLSEGFAEFTAALVLQQSGGWPKYNRFWENRRRYILDRPAQALISNDAAGPISQGVRVASWQNGSAVDAMMYSKGAYVLHMLRMAMMDHSKPNPDAPFMAMMTDFAQTYAGKNPSTTDFQHVVEKYLPPSLNLTRNGKIDWFFNQWVYGIAIPKLDSKFTVTDAGGGKYKVSGTMTQSQVPDNFVSLVALYINFDKGAYAKIASVPVVGNQTKPIEFELPLPKAPKAVTINNMHDVLAR